MKKFKKFFFENLLNNKNIKKNSGSTSLAAVFAECFNRTIRDLLKRPVFEKRDGNWIDVLPITTKQNNNNRIHSSTELTPIQPSLQKNVGFVYKNLLDNRKKLKPKFQLSDVVRTGDIKRIFSKGDTTKWSYKLYKETEIIFDTIPS